MKEFGNVCNLPQKTGFWEEKIDLTPPIALFSRIRYKVSGAVHHDKISRLTKVYQNFPAGKF